MTAGEGSGSVTQASSCDAGLVSSLGPPNMPTTGGMTTTIDGFSFSFSPGSRFGYTSCESSVWVAVSAVTCKVSSGVNSGMQGTVMVTAGRLVGSLSTAVTYDAPISAVSPSNILAAGAFLLVTGVDLGKMDSTVRGRLMSSSTDASLWMSDTSVVCRSAAGSGSTLPVYLTIARAVDALSQAVSYDGPSVRSVFAIRLRDTVSLSVVGKNFGTSHFSSSIRFGFTVAMISRWRSDSSLLCRSASAHLARDSIVVTAGRLTGTLTNLFADMGLMLSVLQRSNSPMSGSAIINVMGLRLGRESYSASLRIGNSAAQATVWVSESSIRCRISAASGKSDVAASLVITVSGSKGSLSSVFSYDAVSLSAASASNLQSWSQVSVGLLGADYGIHCSSPKMRVAGTDALATSWLSDSSVVSQLDAGYQARPRLVLTIAKTFSTLSDSISYDTTSLFLTQALRSQSKVEATRWLSDIALSCKKARAQLAEKRFSIGVVRQLNDLKRLTQLK